MGITAAVGLVLALQQVGVAGPSSESPTAGSNAAGSNPAESIAEEFLRIGRALYDSDCLSVGGAPARKLERRLAGDGVGPEERLTLMADLGREWLKLGKVQEAIELLERGLALAAEQSAEDAVTRF